MTRLQEERDLAASIKESLQETFPTNLRVDIVSSSTLSSSSSSSSSSISGVVDENTAVYRTVLVSSAATAPSDQQPPPHLMLFGMTVIEYLKDGRIYIEKIDSTGYNVTASSSPARTLVQAYLNHSVCFASFSDIHVFARAQDQFLFPDSAKNKSKRILSQRQLLKWWIKTLSGVDSISSSPSLALPSLQRFFFIPNESPTTVRDISGCAGSSCNWKWGWAYPSTSIASSVITRFPDDAKTKGFDMIDTSSATVEEFSEVLGALGEFAGGLAGFFHLKTKEGDDGSRSTSTKNTAANYTSIKAPSAYMEWNDFLMKQCWDTRSRAQESSDAIISFLQGAAAQHGGLSHETINIIPAKRSSLKRPAAHQQQEQTGTVAVPTATVLNIQSLIKKKAKTDTAPPPAAPVVNNIQSLIKKKK